MTTLLGIPNEVLLRIVHYVPFSTIEDFALTCKTFRSVAEGKLHLHEEKRRTLSTVIVGEVEAACWPTNACFYGCHPIHYLREILEDEENALYLSAIVIGNLNRGNLDFAKDEQARFSALQTFDKTYGELTNVTVTRVYNRLYPHGTDVSAHEWREEIRQGDPQDILKLLLHHLPNLQILTSFDANYPELEGIASKIATSANEHQPKRNDAFQKLTEVRLSNTESEIYGGPEILAIFLALPSIRKIKCRWMDIVWWKFSAKQAKSTVLDLDFFQCGVQAMELRGMLSDIKALQKLTYNFNIPDHVYEAPSYCWEPRKIVEALHQYARESLLHLELTADITWNHDWAQLYFDTMEPCIGSLRDFIHLQTLRLQTSTLFKEVEDPPLWDSEPTPPIIRENGTRVEDELLEGSNRLVEPQRLVDIMPASLKRLELVGGLDIDDGRAMLAGLSELKEERVPRLRRIVFEDNDAFDQGMIDNCKEIDIKLSCWGPDGYYVPR